jgi:hypothetical protein
MKMRVSDPKDQWIFSLWIFSPTIICLILSTLFGCAVVGPRSISMGRADYNEAINRTEDEQLLMSIVKGRYGETSSLLAVSGVAANVRFNTNAAVQVGFGPKSSYDGNLVPFTGGLAYEENPTITYAPVQGQKYLRQLLSPIPLDLLLLAVRSETLRSRQITLLVDRINDLRNPDFLDEQLTEPDSRFMRFVELFSELTKGRVLDLMKDSRKEVAFDFVISGYAPEYSKKVVEFLDLLSLSMPTDRSKEIVIPVYFAVKTRKVWGIGITTRSIYDLVEIFSAAIEVPQEHALKGLTINPPPMGWPGRGIRIISSTKKPGNMSLAVKYRGYWFYIDETDQRTKAFFRDLRAYWSVSIAAAADHKAAPVLTLPVSR